MLLSPALLKLFFSHSVIFSWARSNAYWMEYCGCNSPAFLRFGLVVHLSQTASCGSLSLPMSLWLFSTQEVLILGFPKLPQKFCSGASENWEPLDWAGTVTAHPGSKPFSEKRCHFLVDWRTKGSSRMWLESHHMLPWDSSLNASFPKQMAPFLPTRTPETINSTFSLN